MDKKILVITSCTGEKKYKPENQLRFEDFQDPEHKSMRERELVAYQTTAGEMYTGRQHLELMKGIDEYRHAGLHIDVAILSAGYGMLSEDERIVPYEVTFNDMGKNKIKSWSEQLAITQKLQEDWIPKYDMIFFLLGDKYLQSVNWPLEMREEQKLFFFVGGSSVSKVLLRPQTYALTISKEEASCFHSGLIEIKGFLFAQLLRYFIEHPTSSWTDLDEKPNLIREYILKMTLKENHQISLFEENRDQNRGQKLLPFVTYQAPYYVPTNLIAKNFRTELRYFMPENDDRVDPNYDFINDLSTPKRDILLDDQYAHEFYGQSQYDGVLISKVNIDKATRRKKELLKKMSIHDLLRLPRDIPIMGDCGAFSYIGEEIPPYSTEEVLDYYNRLGFDSGVSVDHLIVGDFEKDKQIREHRYNITLRNAEDFLRKHHERGYSFTPIGVAQGWDPDSFRNAVADLREMGYQYIALGGLAKDNSAKIFEILKAISKEIPNDSFRMHLFGVVRSEEIMESYHKLGVTSFDSTSPLRRAWLGTGHNYHTLSGKHYSAIRVPEAKETSGRVKKQLLKQGGDFQEYKRLELNALKALREFDAGKLSVDDTLEAVLAYDQMLGEKRENHAELYREVLEDMPWKTCGCKICESVGIDVVIFRGNNRNRRRGFHNTYVYYQQLKRLKMKILNRN